MTTAWSKSTLDAHSDQDIIARVLNGHRADFEYLVRRHNQRLYRAVRAIARCDSDAEDALQGAWLNIFRHLATFRGDASFTTWATRIAVNEAISQMGKRPVIAEVTDAPDEGANMEENLSRAQLGLLLERCLANIPQGNREVMILRDVVEMDTAETALCLNVSEDAVRVRLHRARAAVAAMLTEKLSDHARDIYGFDGARCDRITAAVMKRVDDV